MSIVLQFRMMPDGGFICGDTVSGVTAYAYPTSLHASEARSKPRRVAMDMLSDAVRFQPMANAAAEQWPRLAADMAEISARRWAELGEVA